jgi:light-regulated signal transduction histidine kinase (bacteriophytochrome)
LLERRYGVQGDTHDLVQRVTAAVARMHAMITDLLEYSRVATAAAEALPACNAKSSLQEAVWNLQTTIRETEATITSDELPEIRYHPQQLTLLFQNLIGNALKYRRAEPPRVYVSAESHHGNWIFSIRDNGIGFRTQDAERIFDVFKRLHGHEYPGTGIGLAICARTVELHGGRIWAESEVGKGSTFFFTVPT